VTGAGSGLGQATARMLLGAGASVALLDRNPAGIEALAKEFGSRAYPIVTDICNAEDIFAAVESVVDHFGALQVSVNCAGVASSERIISKGLPHDIALWQRVIDVNLTGTFNVLRAVVTHMFNNAPDSQTGERGVVINVASIAAEDGQKGQAAYAASKAGVIGLSLPVARDLADHAIRCIAISPGLFKTELFEQIPDKGVRALTGSLLYPNRMGEPEEFARLVSHIIENAYFNGCCVRLDGATRLSGR